MNRLALLILLFAGACNGPVTTLPPPPPAPPPAPLVVGHWDLIGSQTGERLWIEADGTFSEAGGPDALVPNSLSVFLSSGSWTFTAPTLTLDDVQHGAYVFSAALVDGDLVLDQRASGYRFRREVADAGSD